MKKSSAGNWLLAVGFASFFLGDRGHFGIFYWTIAALWAGFWLAGIVSGEESMERQS